MPDLAHVSEVLDRFISAGLKLKPEKCTFAADEVGYLGFLVSTDGVRPDPSKVEAIQNMSFPKSAREMVRFLGGVNFYRDFIPRFRGTASVLYKMSQSERKFKHLLKTSSTHVHSTFEQLETAFTTAPVLAFPNFDLPFTVQCDAFNVALGAVIGQMVDNQFRPVMYGSRHLSEAESR